MSHCTHCDAPLAHDQRYCVECGARRGPLPELVAAMIAGVEGRRGDETPRAPAPAGVGAQPRRLTPGWLPTPRVAALAVMGMLAFGAEIGAVVGGSGVTALASAPLVLVRHAVSPAAATTPVASSGSDSSGGGVTKTITIPAPASSSDGGSSAAAPSEAATPTTTTTSTTTTTNTTPTNPYGLPDIKHVFVIMLGDLGYSQTFGSQDAYLGKTLPKQGKLIETYYAVAGGELANQIALVSGQGPTQQTVANCPTFANLAPGSTGKQHQVLGNGCVYPHATDTIGAQLTSDHLTWKAYIQGMASSVPGQPQTCRHPALGSADSYQAPEPGNPYVTWRDPFVYFHSVIDAKACQHDVVDLTQLSTDLTNTSTTPNLSYIAANLCDDGDEQPCTAGATAGVAEADSFLQSIVPEIKSSAAYQAGGLILITFDQAPQSGQDADSSSCCATPRYPNLTAAPATPTTPTTTASTLTAHHIGAPATTLTSTSSTTDTAPITTTSTTTPTISTLSSTTPTIPDTATAPTTPTAAPTTTTTSSTTTAPSPNLGQGQTSPTGGGGQVGLLLISPWVKAGTTDVIDYYNHFSLLTSIEDIFDVKHLGYASATGLTAFDASTFDGKGPSSG